MDSTASTVRIQTSDAEAYDVLSSSDAASHLTWADFLVLFLYFVFVLAVGLWSSRRSKKGSVADYFLASRNMHFIPVGASLFASNIGSGHFIGLAGSGAASGIAVAGFELSAPFILMLLGWLFIPVYMSSGIYTMPEYLRERFGGQRIRIYLSLLALILYIFTKISADLYAGALFIQLALNKSSPEWLYISILILLGIAALFTIAGGLTAVIWTDFVQTILMILGAFILMGISFARVGGYQQLVDKFPYALASNRPENGSCGIPPSDYMNLLRSPYPGVSDLPWTGMLIGLTINAIWYWCTDQVIVQRALASKSMIHAKGGTLLAAYLKILPLWLLVFPGMIARILFPDRVGCADPEECMKICGSPGGCTNIAYPELVIKLLPPGLSGLMLSVMMAALMSSLTSIFNSASTIFTIDVWTRFRKNPKDLESVIVGRMFVVVLVVISVLWIPVIQKAGNSKLFDYIQSISSFLSPPICAVYILALFWKRTNEPGAFWGLMTGLVIGMIRFIMEFSFPSPSCSEGPDMRSPFIILTVGNVHYLHFSCILFLITLFVTVSISLVTEPIPEECLHRLTFWSRWSVEVRKKIDEDMEELTPKETMDARNGDGHTAEMQESQTTASSTIIKLIYRICGTSEGDGGTENQTQDTDKTEEAKAKAAAEFLREDPYWHRIVNVNAVVCACITIFVWGFFA